MIIIKYLVFILGIIACFSGLAIDGWVGFWAMFLCFAPLVISLFFFGWFGILMYFPVCFVFAIIFFTAGMFIGIPGFSEPCTHEQIDDGTGIPKGCDICVAKNDELGKTAAKYIKAVPVFFEDFWYVICVVCIGFGLISKLVTRKQGSQEYQEY